MSRNYGWPEKLYVRSDRSGGPDACWPWLGNQDGSGYGLTHKPGGASTRAHRAVYEHEVGPIPEGMQLDHLCRNRICVNPAHLEVVTPEENQRRARYAVVGVCRKGHDVTKPGALKPERGGKVMRCRECNNQYVRAWRARKKVERESATSRP